MTLVDLLRQSTEEFGSRPALTKRMGYRTVTLTYTQVWNMSLKVATFLEQEGLQNGNKVMVIGPNSPYWICVFFGSILRGCDVVPLNVQSTGDFVHKIAKETEAKIMFDHKQRAEDLPEGMKIFRLNLLPELLEEIIGTEDSLGYAHNDDIVELLYTSGTTGDPKGVMLLHGNFISDIEAMTKVLNIPKKARLLSILPLSHSFEQTVGFLLPFSVGAHIIYSHSPAAITELLQEYRITHMVAVPEFLQILMRRMDEKLPKSGIFRRLLGGKVRRQLGGELRTIACGGAPMDPVLEKKWNTLGFTILQGYGLTETAPVVSMNTYGHRKVGSVGKVIPGVNVRIADDGEIWIQGPTVFKGYFKDDWKTTDAFHDNWFKTGDIGEIDEKGFLFIRGRKKYMILGPGGQNVYTEDIENVLKKVDGVRDCCVVGLNSDVHAVLLLEDGCSPERIPHIIQTANSDLASYQNITSHSLWPDDDFPRSATRKIQKEKVITAIGEREEVATAAEGDVTPLVRLLSLVSDVPVERIAAETQLAPDLKIDSLLRIEIIARIEQRFGMRIEEARITDQTTVAELERMVKEAKPYKRTILNHWPRSWFICMLRTIAQSLIISPIMRIAVKLKVEGKEHLKNLEHPVIFMPNHVSYPDPVAIMMALPLRLRIRIVFAAAQDFVYGDLRHFVPFFEFVSNMFPFPRKEGFNIHEGLMNAGKLLDDRWSLVFFPEGKVSESGNPIPFKGGTGLVAVGMNVPVVPMRIRGMNKVFPYNKYFPVRRDDVTITFGKPMRFKRTDSYADATRKLEEAIGSL